MCAERVEEKREERDGCKKGRIRKNKGIRGRNGVEKEEMVLKRER